MSDWMQSLEKKAEVAKNIEPPAIADGRSDDAVLVEDETRSSQMVPFDWLKRFVSR